MVAVWAMFFGGWLHAIPYGDPVVWHAHEMIFGFAVAIMAGFLLTASQNWSGLPGISGARLIGLVALWASARLISIVWNLHPMLFALVDLSFLPMLAYSLKPYLWLKTQKRNRVFFLLFLILFLSNLLIHLDALGIRLLSARSVLFSSIHIFTIMIALIGGRVIPFFAANAIGFKPKQYPWLEKSTFISLVIFLLAVTFWEFSSYTATISLIAALIQFVRWLQWRPWKAIRVPILLILYVGYVWIPIGLFLRAFASFGWVLPSCSTHAFTVGAIGIMTYGMMTRVSLGHTGRKIYASLPVVCGYVLLCLASITRVFGPIVFPAHYLRTIEISGWLWFFAFAIYVVTYGPMLCKPRTDGKPG